MRSLIKHSIAIAAFSICTSGSAAADDVACLIYDSAGNAYFEGFAFSGREAQALMADKRCGCKEPEAGEGCTVYVLSSNCEDGSNGTSCFGNCSFFIDCEGEENDSDASAACSTIQAPPPKPKEGTSFGGAGLY